VGVNPQPTLLKDSSNLASILSLNNALALNLIRNEEGQSINDERLSFIKGGSLSVKAPSPQARKRITGGEEVKTERPPERGFRDKDLKWKCFWVFWPRNGARKEEGFLSIADISWLGGGREL